MPNMIQGACQADTAILLISARKVREQVGRRGEGWGRAAEGEAGEGKEGEAGEGGGGGAGRRERREGERGG